METLQRTANRGSISTGYDIDNSLKLEYNNSEELNFTPSSSGSNQTWTFSCWFKVTKVTTDNPIFGHYTDANNQALVRILSTDKFSFRLVNGGTVRELTSDMLFRDTSAWYHLVVAVDTTDGTSTNRVKVYVNGEQITLTGTYPTPSLVTYGINTSSLVMDIGGLTTATPTFFGFSGYMAEINHIDGQQLAPTEFGETDEDTGIWKPKAYTGTYGTNGAYLNFSNSGSLGEDSAGSNNWTLINITSVDQATDTPTNNFCIINAINLSTQTLTQGATKIVSTDNTSRTSFGTMAVSKGKWWWEGKIQVYESADTYPCIGVTGDLDNPPATSAQLWGTNHVIKLAKAQKWVSNDTGTAYGTAYADNDIINIALDMDNHIMYTYKNGTIDDVSGINFSSQSAATSDDFYIPINLVYVTGGGSSWEMNFGGYANYTISSAASDANGYGTFEYAPPSGYYALCSKNLAEFG